MPHPRLRRSIRWSGLAACIALAATWIATTSWVLEWRGRTRERTLGEPGSGGGGGLFGWKPAGGRDGGGLWVRGRSPPLDPPTRWRFKWTLTGAGGKSEMLTAQVPIWSLMAPVAAATAVAWF